MRFDLFKMRGVAPEIHTLLHIDTWPTLQLVNWCQGLHDCILIVLEKYNKQWRWGAGPIVTDHELCASCLQFLSFCNIEAQLNSRTECSFFQLRLFTWAEWVVHKECSALNAKRESILHKGIDDSIYLKFINRATVFSDQTLMIKQTLRAWMESNFYSPEQATSDATALSLSSFSGT